MTFEPEGDGTRRDEPVKTDNDSIAVLAERAGVERRLVEELVEHGVVIPRGDGGSEGDVRRVRVIHDLQRGGIPVGLLGEALRRGALGLDFVDQPSYDRFSAYEDVTFEELGRRTGVPVELLLVIREATGLPAPAPTDRVRTTETAVLPFIEAALRNGVRAELIERTLRVAGDGARRLAETEADWWRSDILGPLLRSGVPPQEIGVRTEQFATEVGPLTDNALIAIYHGQQANAWMRNIFDGFEAVLVRAGLYERLDRPPAICFFDVTGYSRLTEERGDASAADLAGRIARLVQRVSAAHDGRIVKWLGDGLMLHYPDATAAVLGALQMLDAIDRGELPPAHVGIHAGPVLFQEGDYFGRTVNAAARIAEHAGGGQVLVSEQVVTAVDESAGLTFERIGPVELKGLLAPLVLYAAHRVEGG